MAILGYFDPLNATQAQKNIKIKKYPPKWPIFFLTNILKYAKIIFPSLYAICHGKGPLQLVIPEKIRGIQNLGYQCPIDLR